MQSWAGALVVAATLATAGGRFIRFESRSAPGRSERGLTSLTLGVDAGIPTPNPYLVFAPLDGGGLPYAQNLCDVLTADEVDGGWCLNGDGTSMAGGHALTSVGTVETVSRATCPNGPNCSVVTAQSYAVDAGAQTASMATGTGSVTMCWLGSLTKLGGTFAPLVTQTTAYTIGGISAHLETVQSSAAVRLYVGDGSSLASAIAYSSSLGGRELVCGTWSGVSGAIAYINGTAGAAAPLATRQSLVVRDAVHGFNNSFDNTSITGSGTAQTEGAFRINVELSAARIAAIARAVLADAPVAGLWDGGTLPLTFTRASTRFCDNGSGEGSTLPVNRPCITQGGLSVEGARTNLLLRSEEIDNAAWSKGPAVGTITANYAIAPNGTLTADRYQYSNTNNDYVLQSCNVGGSPGAMTVYLKGTSGSGALNFCRGGGTGQCVSCAYTSTAWSRCEYSANLAASTNVFIGCETGTLGGACAQTGLDVLVWGLQCEFNVAYSTSYIATGAASATRAADVAYIDTGATTPLTGDNMTISAAFVALPATTTDNYPALLKVASDSNASNSGKGLWLYSPNSYGATFACLSANEAGGGFLTGVAARDGGANVRGWCSTVDSGVVSGAFNGVAMSDSSAPSGSFNPARYVILAGSTLASPDAIKKDICLTEYKVDAGVCAP